MANKIPGNLSGSSPSKAGKTSARKYEKVTSAQRRKATSPLPMKGNSSNRESARGSNITGSKLSRRGQ